MLLASGRRVMVAVGMVAFLFATAGLSARTQDPAKPQEPAKPAEQADPLKFDYDGPMILVFQIKPDRIADFEAFWPGLRAGLAKSDKPELKAFGETLTPYKVQGVQGLYLLRLDHPSKTFTYNPSKLLYDNINYEKPELGAFTREEADTLFKKFNESWVPQGGIQAWKLEKAGTPTP
jgi:hypothetical protein